MALLDLLRGKYIDARQKTVEGLKHAKRLGQNVWIRGGLLFLSYLEGRLGNPQKALDSLDEAWKTAVEDEDFSDQRLILHAKGLVYLEMGSAEKARDEADRLKTLNEQGMNKLFIFFYHHLVGRIELERKEYSKAIENFKMSLELLPAINVAHLPYTDSLGSAYYENGELNNAKKEYEKIIHLTIGRSRQKLSNIMRNFLIYGRMPIRDYPKSRTP
jgi:tetratricopeptide (TPR) repeat protein